MSELTNDSVLAHHLAKVLYWKPKFWQQGSGYTTWGFILSPWKQALCAGGAAIDILIKYIENQGYDD